MDRTERFYKIDQILKDRKVASFAALRSSLGVSRATLRRDLDYMRDRLHAPIEYDRDANGYRFGKPALGAALRAAGALNFQRGAHGTDHPPSGFRSRLESVPCKTFSRLTPARACSSAASARTRSKRSWIAGE